MQTKTRHPGTDNGKVKYWGKDGIDIPVPAVPASKIVNADLQQSCFERGWFIRFNARCRDIAKAKGVEKMRAEVESKVGDMQTFCDWMNEKAPRATRELDLTPLYKEKPNATKEEVAQYLQENGFKAIIS